MSAGVARHLSCAVIIVALWTRGADARQPIQSPIYQAFFYQGIRLDSIPDYSKLAPAKGSVVNNLTLTLVAGQLQGPANVPNNQLFTFNTYMYVGGIRGGVNNPSMFGPTIRVSPDTNISLRLTNELIGYPKEKEQAQWENSFHQPTHTNIHMHGIWQFPGVLAQPASGYVTYTTGDTVFVDVPSRENADADPSFIEYTYYVHKNHMPGTYWYHPHHHGSTALQSMTSSGVIIIDGDAKHLDTPSCKNLAAVVPDAPEQVLFIQTMFFNSSSVFDASMFTPGFGDHFDSSMPEVSNMSDPMNPLCCNSTENGLPFELAEDTDTAFISGAYQPIINLEARQYMRWRIINASWKRYVELFIIHENETLAEQCEMQLIAKDGLYMLHIPRKVQHVVLPASGRADVLVRCSTPGNYTLSSGYGPNLYGPGVNLNNEFQNNAGELGQVNRFRQKVMANITVNASTKTPDPTFTDHECKPLRSDYTADLGDENLAKNNVSRPSGDLLKKVSWSQPPNIKGNVNPGCFINPVNASDLNQYQFPDPNPVTFIIGTVAQIDFVDQAFHPGHLHENPMQIYFLNRTILGNDTTLTNYWMEGDFHDTVYVPVLPGSGATEVKVRVQPGPFTGYSVFHCHFLHHEDQGCMKVIKWQCPGHPGNEQPFPCPDFEAKGFPVKGDFSTKEWPDWAYEEFQKELQRFVAWQIAIIAVCTVLGAIVLILGAVLVFMCCCGGRARHNKGLQAAQSSPPISEDGKVYTAVSPIAA
ncbi:g2222 [Coccomyxa elongata]